MKKVLNYLNVKYILECIRDSIDSKEVLEYSKKTSPKLHATISSGVKLEDAFWEAYQENLNKGSFDSAANYNCVLVDETHKRTPN